MKNEISVLPQSRPLNGWRAIAEYLGRNQSTVKRWANDGGLPVHRPKGSSARKGVPVYAFAGELDIWLRGHGDSLPDTDLPEPPATDPLQGQPGQPVDDAARAEQAAPPPRIGRRMLTIGGLAAAVLGLAAWRRHGTVGAGPGDALSPEVRKIYLEAHYLWQRRTPDSLQQAEQLLQRVLRLAPGFADAQADLATVYNLMVEYRVLPPREGYDRSRAAAGLAIALDPDLARAYSVLGDIAFFWDRNYDLGLGYLEKAVQRGSGDALCHHWYGSALLGLGRFQPAADQILRARAIEPLSRSIAVSSAMVQLGLGQPENARAALRQLVANEPGYRSPYRFIAFAELALGDHQAYLEALETRYTLTADSAGLAVVRAGKPALQRAGPEGMAAAMLAACGALPPGTAVEPYSLAHFMALAGHWQAAARKLGETPTRHAFYYGIDPAFALARQDEEFLRIIASTGLPIIRSRPA